MIHQALYLRYRPKRFSEVKGQDHVIKAIRTSVRDGKVGHAYMLHGPRGTGKTTTARILAKALNCTNLGSDGEPCCECESCISIEQNRSFDLYELDAASNNKVDDMRTLLERVNLATPGRSKVYLLDEVHMLTPGAENALLKNSGGASRPCDMGYGHYRTTQSGPDYSKSLPGISARAP